MNNDELREKVAALCHEQWSGWMVYMFSKGTVETIYTNETLGKESPKERVWVMPAWAVDRWQRQMNTPYAKLSEPEQDSDRKEADKFLALILRERDEPPTLGVQASESIIIDDKVGG